MTELAEYQTVQAALSDAESILEADPRAASRKVEAALELHSAIKPAARKHDYHNRIKADLLFTLSASRRLLKQPDDALTVIKEACSLYAGLDQIDAAADRVVTEAQLLIKQGLTSQAFEYFSLAIQWQNRNSNFSALSRIRVKTGNAYFNSGRYAEAREQYDQALALAEEHDLGKVRADSQLNIGNVLWATGAFDDALQRYLLADEYYKSIGNIAARGDVYNNVGAIYLYLGEYALVLEYFLKALSIRQELGDWNRIAGSLLNIGNVYFHMGHDASALEYYLQSRSLYEQHQDKLGLAEVLVNIGAIYEKSSNSAQALESYHRSVQLREECGQTALLASSQINIAIVYLNNRDFEKAIVYAKSALENSQSNDALRLQSYALHCLGEALLGQGRRRDALDYLREALKIRRGLGYKSGEAETLNVIADLEMQNDDPIVALQTLSEALETARDLNEKPREQEILLAFARCYEKTGELHQALEYYHKAEALRKQIERERNTGLLTNLQIAHQVDRLRKESRTAKQRSAELESAALEIRRQKQEIEDKAAQIEAANQRLEAQNKELQLLDKERTEFLSIASHDLRNPLGTIAAMARRIQKAVANDSDSDVEDFAVDIAKTAERAGRIVTQLLESMHQEHKQVRAKFSEHDLHSVVSVVLRSHADAAESKQLKFYYDHAESTKVYVDRDAVRQIVDNLLGNAIKYSPPGASISIKFEAEAEWGSILISDQGPGFTDEDRERLFSRFRTLSAEPSGGESSTGLGLYIAKRQTEFLGGHIECLDSTEQGAHFKVMLPRKSEQALIAN